MARGAPLGSRAPFGNPGIRTGTGRFRSFGNPGFAGVNRINNLNLNRTNIVSNRSNFISPRSSFNNFAGLGYGRYNRGYGRSFGYGRGYGFGLGYPYGRRGYGYGGYGLGGLGFPLGFLLGYGLGGYGYGGYGYGGYGGYGSWGYPYGYGLGSFGYGPSSWLYGGSLYGYGYVPYSNPYYVSYAFSPGLVVQPYDYSLPIITGSAPPAQSVADEALALFGSARASFKAGDFALALQQADDALTKTPNDSSLHEFRALCLFALGRYDEAATVLYAVLSVGPGWDWPSLIGLYPNIDVYTAQQRALEAYCQANPQSSSARFVLAYHYLTQGHFDAAARTLRQVVALKPNDTLSAKLLEQLDAARQNPGSGTSVAQQPPTSEPVAAVNTAVPEGATIAGAWTAHPSADTSVTLTIQPEGTFNWQVVQKGQTRQFSGNSTFGNGVLTLVPDGSQPIVGRVSWTDASRMNFRVIGDSPDAPGLSFSK